MSSLFIQSDIPIFPAIRFMTLIMKSKRTGMPYLYISLLKKYNEDFSLKDGINISHIRELLYSFRFRDFTKECIQKNTYEKELEQFLRDILSQCEELKKEESVDENMWRYGLQEILNVYIEALYQ